VIELRRAPPFATVQDLGFPAGRAFGLPRAGAMDPAGLARANRLVGNPSGAAGVEAALGGLGIRTAAAVTLAVWPPAELRAGGRTWTAHAAWEAEPERIYEIEPDPGHRFCYLAVRGGIGVPELLGSRSTYLPGGFGGFAGRRLGAGDVLPVGAAAGPARERPTPELLPLPPEEVVLRVTRGPQWDHFPEAARSTFLSAAYRVGRASDRMGYRLNGPAVASRGEATLPSEPACPGAVQVPAGGEPIVLMPDGPTVGGYPKLAVVVQADLRLLAQCPPGRAVRFREVSLGEARACYSPLP
jgi:antagonist of KipI